MIEFPFLLSPVEAFEFIGMQKMKFNKKRPYD